MPPAKNDGGVDQDPLTGRVRPETELTFLFLVLEFFPWFFCL